MTSATTSETTVTPSSTISIFKPQASSPSTSSQLRLPQLELDADLHDHIDRHALHAARRKAPLPHGLRSRARSARRAVRAAPSRRRRCRRAARRFRVPLRPRCSRAAHRPCSRPSLRAAGAAARRRCRDGTVRRRCRRPSHRPRRCHRLRRGPCLGPVPAPPPAPGPWLGGVSGAFASTPSRFSASAGLVAIGAITGGSVFASSGGGGGSGGFGSGRMGGGSLRAGNGLLMRSTPLRMALGGGVFMHQAATTATTAGSAAQTRNTMRMGSSLSGSVRSSATARPRLATNRIEAIARPCRLVETTSGTVVERCGAHALREQFAAETELAGEADGRAGPERANRADRFVLRDEVGEFGLAADRQLRGHRPNLAAGQQVEHARLRHPGRLRDVAGCVDVRRKVSKHGCGWCNGKSLAVRAAGDAGPMITLFGQFSRNLCGRVPGHLWCFGDGCLRFKSSASRPANRLGPPSP